MKLREAFKAGKTVYKVLWHGIIKGSFKDKDSGKLVNFEGKRVLLGSCDDSHYQTEFTGVKLFKCSSSYIPVDDAYITPYFNEYGSIDNDEVYDAS